MTRRVSDPETYKKCCKPHSSVKDGNKNIAEFIKALSALRIKHQIAEVSLVIETNILNSNGMVSPVLFYTNYGNPLRAEVLAAYGLSSAREEYRNTITLIMGGHGFGVAKDEDGGEEDENEEDPKDEGNEDPKPPTPSDDSIKAKEEHPKDQADASHDDA